MDIKVIKDEIKSILDGLTGAGADKLFSVVYDYPKSQPESYPSARVYALGGGVQEILSYSQVYQTISMVVDCLFPYSETKAAYDNVLDTLKNLLIELNKQSHYTLDGNAAYVLADQYEMIYPLEQDTQKYFGFSVLVEIKKVASNT